MGVLLIRRGAGWLALVLVLAGACHEVRHDTPVNEERVEMNGAISPSGEKHPGVVTNDDRVEGRSWTERAEDLPQTLAWVEVAGRWRAVTRIEITGAGDRRCITKFDAAGEMLETTMAHLGPPRPAAPPGAVPTPTPMPTPTPTPIPTPTKK